MKRAPETLIVKHAADPRSRTSPATSTRTSSTATSTRTSSTPAKKERPRIKGWGRKPSDVDAGDGDGDERSRRTLHALERTAELSRVAQSRSLEPAEVEELAGLVAVLLTCQECDAPALFRRCAAHR